MLPLDSQFMSPELCFSRDSELEPLFRTYHVSEIVDAILSEPRDFSPCPSRPAIDSNRRRIPVPRSRSQSWSISTCSEWRLIFDGPKPWTGDPIWNSSLLTLPRSSTLGDAPNMFAYSAPYSSNLGFGTITSTPEMPTAPHG